MTRPFKRRHLLAAAVVGTAAAGTAAVAGTAARAAPADGGATESAADPAVWMPNEFDRLREVFVGAYDYDAPMPASSYSVLQYMGAEFADDMDRNAGRTLREVHPPEVLELFDQEIESLVAVYESQGVTVRRPRSLTTAENEFVQPGGIPIYARDPVLAIRNTVIDGAVMMPFRRKEVFSFRDGFDELADADPAPRRLAVPQPIPTELDRDVPEQPGPFLEGGDVFVLDDEVLVGHSGLASNTAGLDWLRRHFEGLRFHQVRLQHQWLHLDCVLAVVRPGLAICHREGFLDGLPEPIADWEIIDATADEAHVMGCNTVCVAPNRVVIPNEHTRLIEELVKRDVEIVGDFSFEGISQGGGGVRCATMPIRRGN
ncbi:MAG: dimethylarginine dimethylaminohydrolase family protein [Propionibacteriaceae bacterium]